jgi:hypothetical protein
MYAQVEKSKENKSRTDANSAVQKKSSVNHGDGFVDNRTSTSVINLRLLAKEALDHNNKVSMRHELVVQRTIKLRPAPQDILSQPGFDELTRLVTEFNTTHDMSKLKSIVQELMEYEHNAPHFYTDMMQQITPVYDKVPFVEFGPGKEDRKTRVNTGLLAEPLQTDEAFRNKKDEINKPPSRAAHYLFHSTTYKNLQTIYDNGLDPNMGGSAVGASELAEGKLKEDSLKGSKGFVHGATKSEIALEYAKKFSDKENKKETREVAGFSVVLRFLVGGVDGWIRDTEDGRGNYKTQKVIPPGQIEFLEANTGWRRLTSIDLSVLKALETEQDLGK